MSKKEGYSRPGLFGGINHYDANGHKIGESRPGLFGGCLLYTSYKGLSMDEIIHHLAIFISRLWQIHIFGEGNTRTTAVFFIKYLRMLGFSATNDIFAENAWYLRNALVRANYTNLQKGIPVSYTHLDVYKRQQFKTEALEADARFDEIGSALKIKELQRDKRELLESLEMY